MQRTIRLEPNDTNVVSILVGINDVWQRTMEPDMAGRAASPAEFEVTYDQLLPLQREIDRQIVGIPPEKWSPDTVHPYLWAHAWIAQQWLDATGL